MTIRVKLMFMLLKITPNKIISEGTIEISYLNDHSTENTHTRPSLNFAKQPHNSQTLQFLFL